MEKKIEETEQKKKKWGALVGVGTLLLALGGKFKILLPLLKLLKLGKVGGTIWSMLLMVWTYSIVYPWEISAGLVLMLFIHEMGHVVAAKYKGLPISAPAFIPFVGAVVMMKKQPQDAQTEAFVAFGGPLIGSIGAFMALMLGYTTGYEPFFIIAWIGFLLNLVNLLPIHPLDGGRIVTAISRWLWLVGLVVGLVVIIFVLRSLLFFLIWALFAWELYKAFVRDKDKKEDKQFFYVNVPKQRFADNYMHIPGSEHRRTMEYKYYSKIEDQTSYVEVTYPGLGVVGEIPFDCEQLINVDLVGTSPIDGENVKLILEFTYIPKSNGQIVKDNRYYQVPLKTRVAYGVAYFALCGVLGLLMLITFQSVPLI